MILRWDFGCYCFYVEIRVDSVLWSVKTPILLNNGDFAVFVLSITLFLSKPIYSSNLNVISWLGGGNSVAITSQYLRQ